MEEKERYEIHIYNDTCVDLYDNDVLDKSINDTYKLEELLNQQSKRIKELEEATTHYDALVEENNTFLMENSKMTGEIKDLQSQLAIAEKALELACKEELREIGVFDEDDGSKQKLLQLIEDYKQEAKEMLENE